MPVSEFALNNSGFETLSSEYLLESVRRQKVGIKEEMRFWRLNSVISGRQKEKLTSSGADSVGQRLRSDTILRALRKQGSFYCPFIRGREHSKGFKLKSIPVKSLANLACSPFQLVWRYHRQGAFWLEIWKDPWK